MKVTSHRLYDERYGNQWFEEVEDHWDYKDFLSNERWRKGWISVDCGLYNPEDERIYLGITSFDAEIFKAFDLKTNQFIDLGYSKIANEYDAKFHRSLLKRKKDGCIYGGIALLHDSDKQWEAPGGAIIKYNPETDDMERMDTPVEHVYIQSMALDEERDIMYCQCFPPEYLIAYDMKTRKVTNLGLVGTGYSGMAQCENIVLDDDGNLWGPWSITRAWQRNAGVDAYRIFKVPAGEYRMEFLTIGLPKRDGSHGYEKMDSIFNFHDGYIYASGGNGSIYRIDRHKHEVSYLFTPIEDRPSRLSSMVLSNDGYAYGVTGRGGKCELLRFDFKNTKYELLGDIVDQDGEPCWQIHDITTDGKGKFFACENDNPYRSGYLWEIEI